jgi:FixJ family two-component response regulator
MPNLSGADLARSLQVEERDVPVIFISGYPADVLSAEGLLDAPGTLLLKPLAAPELACAVQAALHSPGGLPQKERSL